MKPWRPARRRLNPRCNETAAWQTAASSLRSEGVFKAVLIAIAFATLASLILMLRSEVVPYRPGQYVPHDIVARTEFDFVDDDKLAEARRQAAIAEPRIFRESRHPLEEIRQALLALPDRLKGQRFDDLKDVELSSVLDNASMLRLQEFAEPDQRGKWELSVNEYIASLRKLDLVIVDDNVRGEEISLGRQIQIVGNGSRSAVATLTPSMGDAIYKRVAGPAQDHFSGAIWPKIAMLTKLNLVGATTYELDEQATLQAESAARASITNAEGIRRFAADQPIVRSGVLRESDWTIERAENRAYRASLGARAAWFELLGLVGWVTLITVALSIYVAMYAKRIVQNHVRGVALVVTLLATLLIAQLSAVGSTRLYFAGVAPTLLCAMIMSIVYDRRFALGVARASRVARDDRRRPERCRSCSCCSRAARSSVSRRTSFVIEAD